MQNIFGWLTPAREFVSCSAYGHLGIIKDPVLKQYLPCLDAEICRVEALKEQAESNILAGEHPEWHWYEMAQYSLEDCIVCSLYDAGCLRVGSYRDILCFEGRSSGIKNLYQCGKDLAENHNMTAKFEVRKVS